MKLRSPCDDWNGTHGCGLINPKAVESIASFAYRNKPIHSLHCYSGKIRNGIHRHFFLSYMLLDVEFQAMTTTITATLIPTTAITTATTIPIINLIERTNKCESLQQQPTTIAVSHYNPYRYSKYDTKKKHDTAK